MLQAIPVIGGGTHVIDIGAEVRNTFADTLRRWGASSSTKPTGHARVLEAIAVLDHALDALGSRDGAGLKATLTEKRAALLASVEAAQGLAGETLGMHKVQAEGPVFLDLLGRYLAAYRAQVEAQAAMNAADREHVLARRADLDLCEADTRAVLREIQAFREAVAFPALATDFAAPFVQAEQQCADLVRLAKIPQPARALFAALEQGRTTRADVAKLWPCFAPVSGKAAELCEWRSKAFHEEHGQ